MVIPDESIICPWSTSIAYATEAVGAGVELMLGVEVTDVGRDADAWLLGTTRGTVRASWVVNAAGLAADTSITDSATTSSPSRPDEAS